VHIGSENDLLRVARAFSKDIIDDESGDLFLSVAKER
jgi:hypothetical protein